MLAQRLDSSVVIADHVMTRIHSFSYNMKITSNFYFKIEKIVPYDVYTVKQFIVNKMEQMQYAWIILLLGKMQGCR